MYADLFVDMPKASLVRDQVADGLRQAIAEMRLAPGDRLIERELVDASGVSRATIREALRELAAENLVEMLPQRGAVVASPTPIQARELYDIRAILEGHAGRQCAERATPAQVKAVRRAYEGFRRRAQTGSTQRGMLQAKALFYDALFDGAGNDTVRQILGGLQARITLLRAVSLSQPGRWEQTIDEVGAIVQAIEDRDPDAAEAACIRHVRSAGTIALAALLRDEVSQVAGTK